MIWIVAAVIFYVFGVVLGQATTGASLPTHPVGEPGARARVARELGRAPALSARADRRVILRSGPRYPRERWSPC